MQRLRRYWQVYRPTGLLFYGRDRTAPLSTGSVGKIFRRAKVAAGVDKQGGVHSLRHAYATHQLEAGMPTYKLQRLLGHTDMKMTLCYVHWLPTYRSRGQLGADLLCWENTAAA